MLRKLLLGVGPWIIFSLVLRFGTLELINVAWISFFILHTYFGWQYLKAGNPLSWASSIIFVALFLNSVFGWVYWALQYGAQICYGVFALTAFATIVFKHPFTMTHSKMNTPEEFWHHPLFLSINNQVSGFWACCFAINGMVMMFEYQFPWLTLITTYVILSSAIVFSEYYPPYLQNKAMQRRQQATQPSAA